ncbi:Predicted phospholipase, patatin/cPLA2 family [Granulicatella balaenopterae]|uniref:Predicted phospholipase, patatin/cPLA2 family n=1 Tax=Granulicatella balaenopterae TaxID=137733 RepID=A0A1H9GZF3_9LACT|nr:patatin family protein [Granulicatella balaenopterae]SEQ55445.1 Predicted phospholipase, patatin/cPLA2 family [Granulicatella balaenopterae]
MKFGIVDVGGGERDIYGAGILDYCMDEEIHFDLCCGVSAGSANVVSYMSNQRGRNYQFYTEYAFRREYMSFYNFVHSRSYVNLDYIYDDLSHTNGENPFDYQTMVESGKELIVVATNAITGKATYFTLDDINKNQYDAVKASACLPIVNQAYFVNGKPYYDGGITDPIPYEKALEYGCDKVVIILTHPKDFRHLPHVDDYMAHLLNRHYPEAALALKQRGRLYNQQLEQAIQLEKTGKILILAPDDVSGLTVLGKNKDALINMYHKGYQDASIIKNFI